MKVRLAIVVDRYTLVPSELEGNDAIESFIIDETEKLLRNLLPGLEFCIADAIIDPTSSIESYRGQFDL